MTEEVLSCLHIHPGVVEHGGVGVPKLMCREPVHTFIPELGQHLQHVDANLFRIIIQTGADDAEAVWRQDAAMQLVCLILLVLLLFLIRYLLHLGLRSSRQVGIC